MRGVEMKEILFIAKRADDGDRSGQAGWIVSVDRKQVCEVDSDEMDVGDNALAPLWEALGATLKFDYEL